MFICYIISIFLLFFDGFRFFLSRQGPAAYWDGQNPNFIIFEHFSYFCFRIFVESSSACGLLGWPEPQLLIVFAIFRIFLSRQAPATYWDCQNPIFYDLYVLFHFMFGHSYYC